MDEFKTINMDRREYHFVIQQKKDTEIKREFTRPNRAITLCMDWSIDEQRCFKQVI